MFKQREGVVSDDGGRRVSEEMAAESIRDEII
jgi:hypothetical protein